MSSRNIGLIVAGTFLLALGSARVAASADTMDDETTSNPQTNSEEHADFSDEPGHDPAPVHPIEPAQPPARGGQEGDLESGESPEWTGFQSEPSPFDDRPDPVQRPGPIVRPVLDPEDRDETEWAGFGQDRP